MIHGTVSPPTAAAARNHDVAEPVSGRCSLTNAIIDANCGARPEREHHRSRPTPARRFPRAARSATAASTLSDARTDEQCDRSHPRRDRDPTEPADGERGPEHGRQRRAGTGAAQPDRLRVRRDPTGKSDLDADVQREEERDGDERAGAVLPHRDACSATSTGSRCRCASRRPPPRAGDGERGADVRRGARCPEPRATGSRAAATTARRLRTRSATR